MIEPNTEHLKMIQSVIERMARTSFLLKGWSVTLASAIFVLVVKDANRRYAWIALLPIFAFWWLDAYYLRQEKLFRALYERVRKAEKAEPRDLWFSMDTTPFQGTTRRLPWLVFTPTLIGIHGILSLLAVAVASGLLS